MTWFYQCLNISILRNNNKLSTPRVDNLLKSLPFNPIFKQGLKNSVLVYNLNKIHR